MGKRLTHIATRTGDDGTTGLGNNTRISKASARMRAIGDADELNSHIGLLLCEDMPADARELLTDIQHQLFNLGGELATPGAATLGDEALAQLDAALERYNAALPSARQRLKLRASTNIKSERRFRYRRGAARKEASSAPRATTLRSARRATVRHTCACAAARVPAGKMNSSRRGRAAL